MLFFKVPSCDVLLVFSFNFSGSSSGKAKAAELAAGKRPQIVISDAAEELRDSGSSKLKVKDAAGKSKPDLFHSKNVSFSSASTLVLLFPSETDATSALQVVAMMASKIVKAHDLVEKERDDAQGIIRMSVGS